VKELCLAGFLGDARALVFNGVVDVAWGLIDGEPHWVARSKPLRIEEQFVYNII
jgi:hypothetical protein